MPGIVVKVQRPYEVRFRYQDANGEIYTKHFNGAKARFALRCMDMMEGKIFWDHADYFHRQRAKRKWKLVERKIRQINSKTRENV